MQNIRNIAIIAHVDHGKTTLVDKIIHATHVFRDNQESGDLIMDNNDLKEKEELPFFLKTFRLRIKILKLT
jgi:GTP-binding protein